MKRILLTFAVLLMPLFAKAQTTYTVTQDTCAFKSNSICLNIPVIDQNNASSVIGIDNRPPSRTGYLIFGPWGSPEVHGAYVFPTASAGVTSFDGVITYTSDDGTVTGNLTTHAVFVKCSTRYCTGGSWLYTIKAGSTVNIQ